MDKNNTLIFGLSLLLRHGIANILSLGHSIEWGSYNSARRVMAAIFQASRFIIVEGLLDNNNFIESIYKLWTGVNTIVLGEFPQKKVQDFKEKGIKVLGKPFEITQIISTINNLKISQSFLNQQYS